MGRPCQSGKKKPHAPASVALALLTCSQKLQLSFPWARLTLLFLSCVSSSLSPVALPFTGVLSPPCPRTSAFPALSLSSPGEPFSSTAGSPRVRSVLLFHAFVGFPRLLPWPAVGFVFFLALPVSLWMRRTSGSPHHLPAERLRPKGEQANGP